MCSTCIAAGRTPDSTAQIHLSEEMETAHLHILGGQQREPEAELDASLVGQRVEFFGLIGRKDLNGKLGSAFEFDHSKGRYSVLLESTNEHACVKPANLRLQLGAPLSDREIERQQKNPHVHGLTDDSGFLALPCSNYQCGKIGIATGEESTQKARKALTNGANAFKMCANCKEATYCSKECQAAHWPFHKQICKVAKQMHAIEKFFTKCKDANKVLQSFADEDQNGLDKRRLIHIKCPDIDTLTQLTNKEALMGGLPVDIHFFPVAELRIHTVAIVNAPGDNKIWETALQQTEGYSHSTHISLVVSAPVGPDDSAVHVRQMLIRRQ
jgi:hypothetical protein